MFLSITKYNTTQELFPGILKRFPHLGRIDVLNQVQSNEMELLFFFFL